MTPALVSVSGKLLPAQFFLILGPTGQMTTFFCLMTLSESRNFTSCFGQSGKLLLTLASSVILGSRSCFFISQLCESFNSFSCFGQAH
jgi:hypothetical protein